MVSTGAILNYIYDENRDKYKDLIKLRLKSPEEFNGLICIERERILEEELQIEKYCLKPSETYIGSKIEGIKYINKFSNYEENKAFSREMIKKSPNINFFISKSHVLKGRVCSELFDHKKQMKLASYMVQHTKHADVEQLFFMDEYADKRQWKTVRDLFGRFWIYKFTSNHESYLLLSEERLNIENCVIEGNKVNFKDSVLIGEKKMIGVSLPIILVNKVTSTKPVFKKKQELIKYTKSLNLSSPNYFNWLMSHEGHKSYRHPKYFEYLISSFLLCSKRQFPLHLFIIAQPGTGKSTIEESIWEKFDEDVEIIEGSCSTMKALIPSFKNTIPEEGALLKSNRICVIDEFLRILTRTEKEQRQIELAMTNPILEHKKNRKVSSGNGSLRFNPTSRALAVTNPIFGTANIQSLTFKFDNSFLSRWMIWYQEESHIKAVQSRKMIESIKFKIKKDDWLGMVDFLHSFDAKFEEKRIIKLMKVGELMFQDQDYEKPLATYTARAEHHLFCLMDGIIKTRCITEFDDSFEANEEDYKMVCSIWLRMLKQWKILSLDWMEDKTIEEQIEYLYNNI